MIADTEDGAERWTENVGDFDGPAQSVESWIGQYSHRFTREFRVLLHSRNIKIYDDERFIVHLSNKGIILSVSRQSNDTLNPKSTLHELEQLIKQVPIEPIPIKFPRDSFEIRVCVIGDLSLKPPKEHAKSKKTVGIFEDCHQKKDK